MAVSNQNETPDSSDFKGSDALKRFLKSTPKFKGASDEALNSKIVAIENNPAIIAMRNKRQQQDLKNKRQDFLMSSFLLLILALIVYAFYLVGLVYSGLILMGGSVLGLLWILYDGKQSSGGNWASWMLIPLVGILFVVGLVLFLFGL